MGSIMVGSVNDLALVRGVERTAIVNVLGVSDLLAVRAVALHCIEVHMAVLITGKDDPRAIRRIGTLSVISGSLCQGGQFRAIGIGLIDIHVRSEVPLILALSISLIAWCVSH